MALRCPESCGKCGDNDGGSPLPPNEVAMQGSIIKLVSEYGTIHIRLRPDWERDLVTDILGLFLDIYKQSVANLKISFKVVFLGFEGGGKERKRERASNQTLILMLAKN